MRGYEIIEVFAKNEKGKNNDRVWGGNSHGFGGGGSRQRSISFLPSGSDGDLSLEVEIDDGEEGGQGEEEEGNQGDDEESELQQIGDGQQPRQP